ncbi:hypothetical protein [Cellulomonas sp. PhB150]|uniref:hypothetical protein n=1 Tax=Cellulomonas sp. PhB150 TaxID=2485188 RepID=UPI000F470D33|nr:hypothetical protein [Cellulomonas sp. PhB150]
MSDPAVRQLRVVLTVADGTTRRLEAAGTVVVAPPVRTPWDSLNSRLAGPEGVAVTLLEEH